jgi:mannose-6-phosphate isomerase-like protein (cupin superfamily)
MQGKTRNGAICRVRHVDDCPVEILEGVKLRRVLAGTAFDNVGCEYVVMEPGQVLAPHVHERAHSFILVIDGRGVVSLEDRELEIGPGHTIYIPCGIKHGFRTLAEPLVLYGFQSPPIIHSGRKVDLLFESENGPPTLWAAE